MNIYTAQLNEILNLHGNKEENGLRTNAAPCPKGRIFIGLNNEVFANTGESVSR